MLVNADEYQQDLEINRDQEEDPEYLASYSKNQAYPRLQLPYQQFTSKPLKLEKSTLSLKRDIFSTSPKRDGQSKPERLQNPNQAEDNQNSEL